MISPPSNGWSVTADAVTVAEVAAAAAVTEKTVFNHFRSKEDLVYSGDAVFEAALLGAVRDRPVGEPALRAAERFLLGRYRRLELDPDGRRRARDLADLPDAKVAARALRIAREAFALLAGGFGGYAANPGRVAELKSK